jgi:hypothetical protein
MIFAMHILCVIAALFILLHEGPSSLLLQKGMTLVLIELNFVMCTSFGMCAGTAQAKFYDQLGGKPKSRLITKVQTGFVSTARYHVHEADSKVQSLASL